MWGQWCESECTSRPRESHPRQFTISGTICANAVENYQIHELISFIGRDAVLYHQINLRMNTTWKWFSATGGVQYTSIPLDIFWAASSTDFIFSNSDLTPKLLTAYKISLLRIVVAASCFRHDVDVTNSSGTLGSLCGSDTYTAILLFATCNRKTWSVSAIFSLPAETSLRHCFQSGQPGSESIAPYASGNLDINPNF